MNAMKRNIFIIVFILFAFHLSACAQKEEHRTSATLSSENASVVSDSSETKDSDDGNAKILFEGERYVILDAGSGPDGNYIYRIFDRDGNVVREEKTFREPRILKLSETVFGVEIIYGTGFSTAMTFYYDTEADQMSEDFPCVLTQTNSRIVCGDMDRLIVRSIFDESFYCEIKDFQSPLAKITDIPFQKAEFVQDGKGITVTYLTGEHDKEKDLDLFTATETILFEPSVTN